MATDAEILDHVHAALTCDPRVRAGKEGPIKAICSEGQVVLAGEVDEIPQKMVPERLARAIEGVKIVVNELKLRAIPRRSDAEILAHLMDALEQDHSLDERQITPVVEGAVVTLTGTVDALAKKRLAGLLTWWTAGVEDVRNHLVVQPAEDDCDAEIVDAIRVAHELDILVDANRIGVKSLGSVVTLVGTARSAEERRQAEADAWFTWGVTDVVNKLEIQGVAS